MEEHSSDAIVEVDASVGAHKKDVDLMSPDTTMLVLTWVTFFLLLAVLQKFAWKPIITALEKREDDIRKSLENADKIKVELADVQASKDQILSEAHKAAQGIVEESRKRAQDIAHTIEDRAKQQAQDIVTSAHQEIAGERERARTALRRESAEIAVGLASKILDEKIDADKSRSIIDKYMKEL